MPTEFDAMVDAIKKTLRKQNPKMKEEDISSKAFAMATANWKKSHNGKAPSREKVKDWRILEFFVPIDEKIMDNDDFIIRGVAINETTTLNNVKYVADELEKAAPTFRNVPILLDHKNEVKNIVGRTTEKVNFNPTLKRIDFEGKIMDKDIREMIKDGRIGSVSIGAKVADLQEEADGSKKAIGIKGLEISLVAVPGDSQANLAQAIQQGIHLKEMANEEDKENDINLDEEDTDEDEEDLELEKLNKKEDTMAEEKVTEVAVPKAVEKVEEKDNSEILDLKKQISEIAEMLKEKKKIEENIKEDATKGVVATEKVETLDKLNNAIFEKADNGKGYMLYKDYSKESADTKLKRLIR